MWLRGRGAASQQRAACDARFGTGGDEGAHVVQVVEASDVERRPELAEVFLDLLGVPLSLGDVPARAAGRALHAGREDVAGRLSSVSNQACQPGSAGSARRQPRRTRVPAAFVRAGGQAGVEEDRDGEVRPQRRATSLRATAAGKGRRSPRPPRTGRTGRGSWRRRGPAERARGGGHGSVGQPGKKMGKASGRDAPAKQRRGRSCGSCGRWRRARGGRAGRAGCRRLRAGGEKDDGRSAHLSRDVRSRNRDRLMTAGAEGCTLGQLCASKGKTRSRTRPTNSRRGPRAGRRRLTRARRSRAPATRAPSSSGA